MSEKAGVKLRSVALQAYLAWKEGKGFLGELVHRFANELESRDRAIALDIVLGLCRNESLMEYNLKRFVKRMPEEPLKILLLCGIYQLYSLKKYPEHATVDVTVELAKLEFGKKQAAMVNGVLRNILRQGIEVPRASKKLRDVATAYSHPSWMVHRWVEEFGFNKAIRRLRANNEEPYLWFRLNPQKTDKEAVEARFEVLEWRFERYFRIQQSSVELLGSEEFKQGFYSVQDPSSWLLTRLLDLKGEETLLDYCAAPGGKSALLGEEFPKLNLVCTELKWNRLQRIQDLKRLGLTPDLLQADGLKSPWKKESFDHILIDAPCSNLGVIARRPEARWLEGVADIRLQAKLQMDLLQNAASLLKPGGVLVYGTCSPELEETVQNIEQFLRLNPQFELESARKYLHRNYCFNHYLRIIPQPGSLDGFFGARLVKKPV